MDNEKIWLGAKDAFSLVSNHIGDDVGVVSLLRTAMNGEVSISARRWHYTRDNDFKTYDLNTNDSGQSLALQLDFVRLLHDIETGRPDTAIWGSLKTCCHKLGDYEIQDYKTQQPLNGWHSVSGLQFCREDIINVFRVTEPNSDNRSDRTRSKGGRSLIHRHPYAAAQATLELIDLPKNERPRLTLASISSTLEPYYESQHPNGDCPGPDIMKDASRDIKAALEAYWEKGE